MSTQKTSPENNLQNILDFDVCKKLVEEAKSKNEPMVILCPHYSINIASKFEDCEQLQFDLDELNDYLGEYVEVSQYDDLVVMLDNNDNQ